MDVINKIHNKTTIVAWATDLHSSVVVAVVFASGSLLRFNSLLKGKFGTPEEGFCKAKACVHSSNFLTEDSKYCHIFHTQLEWEHVESRSKVLAKVCLRVVQRSPRTHSVFLYLILKGEMGLNII